MKCVFCGQPVYETESYVGHRGARMWARGRYLHVKEDAWYCDKAEILPTAPLPECHICKTTTAQHGLYCSAAGEPPRHATPAGMV